MCHAVIMIKYILVYKIDIDKCNIISNSSFAEV